MKKVFAVLMIAGSLVACNNGNDADSKADSMKDKVDSSADAKKEMIDSSADAKKAAIDSMAKKNDSSNMKKDEKKH